MKNIPKLGIVHTLVMSIVFLLSIYSSNAQWVQTSGPKGGYIRCMAFIGTTLFAGTWGGGVFRSTDNGVTWMTVNTGLTKFDVRSLAISGTMLFAGTEDGIFRSTDNGDTWRVLKNSYTISLAISRTVLFAGTEYGVYRSTDNGDTWASTNLTIANIISIVVRDTTLFAGAYQGGIFRSADNGATWIAVNKVFIPYYVRALAFIGTTLFAGTDGGVFRSIDNGATWAAVNTNLTNLNVTSLAVVGTTIFAGTIDGIFTSTNNGDTWIDTDVKDLVILSLSFCRTTLFAGTPGNGLWKLNISSSNINEGVQPKAKEVVSVTAYPNPSSAVTTVSISLPTASSSVEVFSIYGEKVLEELSLQSGNFTIDVSGFPSGVYSAVVTTSDGSIIGRTELVVMK